MYQKLLEAILSNLLSQQEGHNQCLSMMEILTSCGIVNSDYGYCRYNIDDSSSILNSDPMELKDYMIKSYNLLSRLVKDILKSLESKSLIKSFKLILSGKIPASKFCTLNVGAVGKWIAVSNSGTNDASIKSGVDKSSEKIVK